MIKTISISLILTLLTFAQSNVRSYKLKNETSAQSTGIPEMTGGNNINTILTVGDTVWIATSRGLVKTTDNGKTWQNYFGTSAFGSESVSAIAYDYGTHSIWVSIAHSTEAGGESLPDGNGILFSLDGGTTWTHVPQSTDPDTAVTEKYGNNTLPALPVTVTIQNITYAIAITPNVIWTANFAGGLRKHRIDSLISDPKSPWARVILPPDTRYSIKPSDTLNFYVSPVNNKDDVSKVGSLNYEGFSLAVAEDTILYVGTANGINKTTETIKAATTNDIVWEKYNHQQKTDGTISGNFIVSLDYNKYSSSKTLWASTWKANDASEDNGVSFSTDGGSTWNTSLINEKVHAFGFYNDIVIAAADNGAFRSNSFGQTWTLPGNIVDATKQFTLPTSMFYAAQFSKKDGSLWLGSNWGLALQPASTPQWNNNWSIFFTAPTLKNNEETFAYPNPFSPKINPGKTAIRYSTGGGSESVTIRIFNFGMKYVRTVIQNVQKSGTSIQTTWDGKDESGNVVPNGVYFYRIEIGSKAPLFGKIMVIQ